MGKFLNWVLTPVGVLASPSDTPRKLIDPIKAPVATRACLELDLSIKLLIT